MGASLLPILIAASRARQRAVEDAFRAAGAVSPAGARPLAALPALPPGALDQLLARGRVREGAPGTYYLYEAAAGEGLGGRRLLLTLAFWAAVVALPFLLLQFTGAR
jgi:hypothetical protein